MSAASAVGDEPTKMKTRSALPPPPDPVYAAYKPYDRPRQPAAGSQAHGRKAPATSPIHRMHDKKHQEQPFRALAIQCTSLTWHPILRDVRAYEVLGALLDKLRRRRSH